MAGAGDEPHKTPLVKIDGAILTVKQSGLYFIYSQVFRILARIVNTRANELEPGALSRRARSERLRGVRQHGAVLAVRDVGRAGDDRAQAQHLLHGRGERAARRGQALPARHRAAPLLGPAAEQDVLRPHPFGARVRVKRTPQQQSSRYFCFRLRNGIASNALLNRIVKSEFPGKTQVTCFNGRGARSSDG